MTEGTIASLRPIKIAAMATVVTFASVQTTSILPTIPNPQSAYYYQTNTGLPVAQHDPTSQVQSVPEITKLVKANSGLTWEEIAHALGVTRRTVHNWALGSEIDSQNEKRLRKFSEMILGFGFKHALQTRDYLRESQQGQPRYLSLLNDPLRPKVSLEQPLETDGSRLMDNWDPRGFVWSDEVVEDVEIQPTTIKSVRKVKPRRIEFG